MPRTQSLESTLAWQVHLQPCWTTYPCDRLRGRDWKRHDKKTNQRVKWNKIFENLNSGLRITHVRNSMSRINPCLWKCICNHVGGPTLWYIERERLEKAWRMTLRGKLRFQGTPWHAYVTLSHRVGWIRFNYDVATQILGKERDILMALRIPKNLAKFISIWGIRLENKHMKFPFEFLKTSSMIEKEARRLTKLSTFHSM